MKDIPLFIRTPARYLGTEVNRPRKRLEDGMFRVALAFADVYEVAMSHIGLKILYDILNRRPDVFCERAFAPWVDMKRYLEECRLPLTSLETETPLSRFDMIGFSLQYEMSYPTLLTMLRMGEIAPRAQDRRLGDPWIVAGGPCAANPEPLASFVDAFLIGDGERAVLEIVDCLKQAKKDGLSREEALETLSEIEGVYVPVLFDVRYEGGRPGSIRPKNGKTVKRRIEGDLNALPFPTDVVVPLIRAVHDRYAVEIARGCLQGCRFCQAGFIYRPYRERNLAKVEGLLPLQGLLEEGLGKTGYNECSFLSLSAGDYSRVSRLLDVAVERNLTSMVSISLPSLRVASLTGEMIDRIKAIRKTGFTLAPEAGTQRLRNVINKKIDENEIITTIKAIFEAGWHLVKLYFMIGLPTEQVEDIEGLIDLVTKVWRMARRISRKNEVTASISTFVPKPHTPFQWCAMIPLEEIREKQEHIKRKLSRSGLRVKWHDARLSFWEGVLSRGGRPLGDFLLRLSEEGAYLDGWTDQFSGETWERVAGEFDPKVLYSGLGAWEPAALFPWDVISMGVRRDYLWKEYEKALEAAVSPPCPEGLCRQCGVCDADDGITVIRSGAEDDLSREERKSPKREGTPAGYLQIVFMKLRDARYLGHLDMVRAILMAARRSGLPMAYSQGYHPAPKVRFSSPIPLGMESYREVAEFALARLVDPVEVKKRINGFLPKGIRILRARVGSLKNPGGFDTLRMANYVCLFRILESQEADFIMEIARRVQSKEINEVFCPIKGETVSVSLVDSLEIKGINRYPKWLKMDMRIGALPKGVRPMPLLWELFGLKARERGRLRCIKMGNELQTASGTVEP